MSIWAKLGLLVIVLLSCAAGLAKVTQSPAEVAFFKAVGLGLFVVMVFGAIQAAGGVLTIFGKTRKIGLLIATVAFALSALMILKTGNFLFFGIALLPVVISVLLLRAQVYPNPKDPIED